MASQSNRMLSETTPGYPAAAFLNFCPGGVSFKGGPSEWHELSGFNVTGAQPSTPNSQRTARRRLSSPDSLVAKARAADDRLRRYSLLYGKDPSAPHFLPSLSILAGAVFGRLTGVNANSVKKWADVMVLHYLDESQEVIPNSEHDIYDVKVPSTTTIQESTASALKRLLHQSKLANIDAGGICKPRPCGYVFKRGDIAWNCRTCQTDPTCVICDSCFRNSNHEGHEVYFHRTTPGGCCDCGDTEAWKIEGCCPLHRPTETQQSMDTDDDPEEAVKMALRGQKEGLDTLEQPPTNLPSKLAAALGVVVGAAVNCLVEAVDGAGIGADPVQWNMRWADEACRILNGVVYDDECYLKQAMVTPHDLLNDGAHQRMLPRGYRLELRLHNDDVHTFEEVIEALHEPRGHRRGSDEGNIPLVARREDANDMTHHVDADGQVTVKSYSSFKLAMQGYRQLKSKGLHCAVVSSAQVDTEHRARALTAWLTEIAAAHPAAAVIVVHALVQVVRDQSIGGIQVWHEPRSIPPWASIIEGEDELTTCRRRFFAFPPHMESSYVTREEGEKLHKLAMEINPAQFVEMTGTDPVLFSNVHYRLPPRRYRKSPHALWGTLPATYSDNDPVESKHPLLYRIVIGQFDATAATMTNQLTEEVFVVDTDTRKQQESELMLSSFYAHRIPGLHMVSGVGTTRLKSLGSGAWPSPNPMEFRNLLATSSFRAPTSPVVWLLLLDPYPTKQVRGALHALFLSLLVDSRFKCRFAAALGAVAYRPLSTLFCAGVGTEADTPLGFTVQIFTAGSLVRALGNATATEKLLKSDQSGNDSGSGAPLGVSTLPIAHSVLRCIHTNLLGSTKEVNMILNNTPAAAAVDNPDDVGLGNDSLVSALTYQAGEHPLSVQLPAAPDDGFLDSRSTRHKRLPHLLRDLEYLMETPGTAFRLLLPQQYPISPQIPEQGTPADNILPFSTVYSRLLRMAQGMDPQKRKISGGHVEYEQQRWLEAFGLSLNLAGTRDALSESLTNSCSAQLAPFSLDGSHLPSVREAMGNVFTSVIRELKLWLYREGMLETGLPLPPGGTHAGVDHSQVEALQRSTLHVSSSQLGDFVESIAEASDIGASSGVGSFGASASSYVTTAALSFALSCATGVKMTEAQLELIESALRLESVQRQYRSIASLGGKDSKIPRSGLALGDWLRIPHSPLGGDALSFHLPLHRALAKCVRSICYVPVPEQERRTNPSNWWKLPVLDDGYSTDQSGNGTQHPLAVLIRPTLRSSNCRVLWSSGPDCTPPEAQQRRSRAKNVSANIASAKIIHSLADHPLRCLAAAQQIERHLWARNGSSTAGMALNYSSSPLCRSFRDLDVTMVQLSASGFSIGLGARRVFALLIGRFSLDGYLCDPEKRLQSNPGSSTYASGHGGWVNPPRLQDPEHAVALSESFFTTMCILVTELPPPPPLTPEDKTALRSCLRRELLHALAAEPRSHSEAMEAATSASSRRDESAGISGGGSGGGALGDVFTQVLREVGKQKTASARAGTAPSAYELRAECCDEYDPTFFHLRRQDHQHAMDTIARLRKQKMSAKKDMNPEAICLPIVCPPPKSHQRFLPCRLLLHLPAMDAAIRRYLLFAVTGGSWLPPPEPANLVSDQGNFDTGAGVSGGPGSASESGSVQVSTFTRRSFLRSTSTTSGKSAESADPQPFSASVVGASSVSILEVLQLLTLQVHTLEECASLHRILPDLDYEAKVASASLSINSYLGRLIRVPDSLVGVWAFLPFPRGPLPSRGSGENRGSVLGLLITLYEHRTKSGGDDTSGAGADSAGDEGHGGARTLAESGLQWLLRFVNALVDGAPSVSAAVRSATSGVPIRPPSGSSMSDADGPSWTINTDVRQKISGMLSNLLDLWPKNETNEAADDTGRMSAKNREARKAAQKRVMEMMRRKQSAFAATLGTPEGGSSGNKMEIDGDDEPDLCIICRCDDTDGENNGPLGYLGHVQRSRYSQMRTTCEAAASPLYRKYRVVGHRGCQLRKTEAMDSDPLVCLPMGSIVTVLASTVSEKYDVLARRVFVRHVSKEDAPDEVVTEGWASVQSSEGYVILSPLFNMCYSNTRWGGTRPVIRQCGHAAHMKCVETHTLSLHQRAAGEQPYDGRFAANIDDGEFLCPLCKQLSNILIPRDGCAWEDSKPKPEKPKPESSERPKMEISSEMLALRGSLSATIRPDPGLFSEIGRKALRQFGAHLLHAMSVPWERATGAKKRKQQRWHEAIQRWDYDDACVPKADALGISDLMSQLRQQHIAWAAAGHSASAAEAFARGVEEVTPFGTFSQTSDPWTDFDAESKDSHPMLLELRRTLTATSGLCQVLLKEMQEVLGSEYSVVSGKSSVIGTCLADILAGNSWFEQISKAGSSEQAQRDSLVLWSQLTALVCSMPSHVARDGMLSQRHEARAAASAMWSVLGIGSSASDAVESHTNHPPLPFSIRRIRQSVIGKVPDIVPNWGTVKPFVNPTGNDKALKSPFRLGVAAAFLYTPLLAWDLNTLSGAVFSTILTGNPSDQGLLVSNLLLASRILILGRLIQVLVSPNGLQFEADDDGDEDQLLYYWLEDEVQREGSALAQLSSMCKSAVQSRSLPVDFPSHTEQAMTNEGNDKFHGTVGRAILPLARSVVLLLRAASSAVRQRQKRSRKGDAQRAAETKGLDDLLADKELMTYEDGLLILKRLGGPLPSGIIGEVDGFWMSTVKRWLAAIIGFESHHGSRGKSLIPQIDPSITFESCAVAASGPQDMEVSSGEERRAKRDSSVEQSRENTRGMNDPVLAAHDLGQFANDLVAGLNNETAEMDDDDIIDEMDIENSEEEMVDFADQAVDSFPELSRHAGTVDNSDDNSDESFSGIAAKDLDDKEFACVSRCPIIPNQPSFLGLEDIGPGTRGAPFEVSTASAVMCDLSHLGMSHPKDKATKCLIRLPKSFVELYGLVNKVKGRDNTSAIDDSDDGGSTETAICLLTGAVMRSGAPRRPHRSSRPPGACTLHARQVGSGIGIFFLVQKCTVLLMHNNKSAYSASLYVDQHGEEDPGLRRGRPLFLNEARYRALEALWRQQGIPREVAQIRSTSDRVIRDNWY